MTAAQSAVAATSHHDGGRVRPAATAEMLCFRATLAQDAGNDLHGPTTTVVWSFDAGIERANT